MAVGAAGSDGLGELAHRLALEGYLVRAVHDAVQDGVGQRGLVQPGVPGRHRQLAGDERRARAHPVVQQFQQVVSLVRGNRRDAEVVQDEQVQPRQLRQPFAQAAIAVGHVQLLQQPWRAGVEHREAQARGLLPQCAGEPRLAAPGGAGEQHVVAMAQPVPAGQAGDDLSAQAPAGAPVDVLQAGTGDLQAGRLQQALQALAVTPVHLALHQQRQALFKGQLAGRDVGGRVAEGGHHAVQAQGAQLVQGLFVEHGSSLLGLLARWSSVVVARPAHVLVQRQVRLCGHRRIQRPLVQAAAQDGGDALVGR